MPETYTADQMRAMAEDVMACCEVTPRCADNLCIQCETAAMLRYAATLQAAHGRLTAALAEASICPHEGEGACPRISVAVHPSAH